MLKHKKYFVSCPLIEHLRLGQVLENIWNQKIYVYLKNQYIYMLQPVERDRQKKLKKEI